MSAGVEQEIVDVHDDVGKAGNDCLHKALKTSRMSQQPHRHCDPLELAHAGNSESYILVTFGRQQHLPESGGEVDCRKHSTAGSVNFANTFTNILH